MREIAEAVDAGFADAVAAFRPGRRRGWRDPVRDGARLTVERCLELYDAQLKSRHLDLAARELRSAGRGFYTIGSAGHEGNAAVAAALRPTDPALLHYRSGAFYVERARQAGAGNPLLDVLLGVCAAVDEPIAGGRHKVFGHPDLAVVPQTSTIASHLPRAMGVGFAIERALRLGVGTHWSPDAIVVCSFGDASVNHSTATGALNAAAYCAYSRLPMPVLFVCEDNGIGISVGTPPGWIAASYGDRPGMRYDAADGCDLAAAYDASVRTAEWVRRHRAPAFLHLSMVRFLGHAGSDVESAYRRPVDVARDLVRDPLVATARLLVEAGACTPAEIVDRYGAVRDEVSAVARDAGSRRTLGSAPEVMEPIAPRRPDRVAAEAGQAGEENERRAFFGGRLPEDEGPLTLAATINRALGDLLVARPEALVFGEDVAVKGGVYGVTRGLARAAGSARVFDTLLDEQSVLGLALGAGLSGLLPVPEIQYLAYLHNAEDQLRGEAASLQFFSQGRFRNPMVVRIAGLGYQKGFGGHFHNDNAVAVLRDVPGLVVAVPARPDDAAAMLRTCAAAATVDGTVAVLLEPIALYHTRDLHADGDGAWLAPYAGPNRWPAAHVAIGSGRTYGDGTDVTIVTFANGVYMSLRVARRLADAGIGCRVLDLRWLAPLPVADLLREARVTGRVLVVDETRTSGGVSEGVLAALADSGYGGVVGRVASADSFIPLGEAALHVLVSEDGIEKAVRDLVGR